MQTKSQKALSTGIAILVAMVVGFGVESYMKKINGPSSMRTLNKVADEMNKSLPMMVDSETQLTNVIGMDKKFVYNYELIHLDSGNGLIDKISQLKPNMVNADCSTPETRDQFLKNGTTMEYKYYDRNKNYLTAIDILPSDCP